MILEETIETITDLYGESLKRITIERAVIGVSMSGVKLSNGYCGISHTPQSVISNTLCGDVSSFLQIKPMRLKGMSVHQILNYTKGDPMFNMLKIIVLNALSTLFITWNRYFIIEGGNAADCINTDLARTVCVIGSCHTLTERLKMFSHIRLYIVEEEWVNRTCDNTKSCIPIEVVPIIAPLCDTVIITDSAIVDGTIDGLLDCVKPDSTVIVTGPAASLLPDAFLRRNVNFVNGISISKPDKILDMIAEGMSFEDIMHSERGILERINVISRVFEMENVYELAAGGR